VLASRANYSSSDDAIVLEDESGRVALCAGDLWAGAGSTGGGASSAALVDLDSENPHGAKRRRLQHPGGGSAEDGGDDDIEEVAGAAAAAVSSSSSSSAAAATAAAKKTTPFPLQRIVSTLVTGVVLAVRGTVTETGEFAVTDVCVPGLLRLPAAQVPWVSSSSSAAPAAAAARRPNVSNKYWADKTEKELAFSLT
jgi:hypothetical protein